MNIAPRDIGIAYDTSCHWYRKTIVAPRDIGINPKKHNLTAFLRAKTSYRACNPQQNK